jgi:hypothetical protein
MAEVPSETHRTRTLEKIHSLSVPRGPSSAPGSLTPQCRHPSVSCHRAGAEPRKPFFDSTGSAAVSARARSLRSKSRSSSLMRLRSARVACRLARSSSGAASAVVALARHLAGPSGYAPCARQHALLSASFIAAVVTTASSRLPAVQGARADPNLSRNHVDCCALRRQQPRHRSVFECMSVSSQVRP